MLNLISPNSQGNVFRRRRIGLLNNLIAKTLETKPQCKILDVGGTYTFWSTWADLIDWDRVSVTCVNLESQTQQSGSLPITILQGNACDLNQIDDKSFDIAFSNSVIEHVGLWPDMEAMAAEIRRVATRFFVQTPNFWFPIEPHARTPFLHWLPEPIAYRIVMSFRCGFWPKADTVSQAVRTVQSARLLDRRQMLSLFPGAELRAERFVGLTKSLIVIGDMAPAANESDPH